MYTVINNDFVRFEQNEAIQRVDIVCDTTADLPSTEEIEKKRYTPGSSAWIADERRYVMLNHKKEWV